MAELCELGELQKLEELEELEELRRVKYVGLQRKAIVKISDLDDHPYEIIINTVQILTLVFHLALLLSLSDFVKNI